MRLLCRFTLRNDGSVYIVALIFIFLTALLVAGILLITSVEYRNVIRDQWSLTALHLAEAGADDAIWALKNNTWGGGWNISGASYTKKTYPPDGSYPSDGFTDSSGTVIGDYAVTVTNPTSSSPTIESTGYCPRNSSSDKRERTIKIPLQKKNIFTCAIFGDDWVKMASNAETDSYNSAEGAYGGSNIGSNGDVGTNSITTSLPYYAIELSSNAEINGDAQIGPDGNTSTAIELASNADITGTESAASSLQDLPSVSAPSDILPDGGSITLGGTDSQGITSNAKYSSITLDNNSSLTISTAKVYITGNLTTDSNSQITINYNGAVTIYVAGTTSFKSNSDLIISNTYPNTDVTFYVGASFIMDSNTSINNQSQKPSKFSLLAVDTVTDPGSPETDPAIKLNSNSAIYGTVYAKNAGVLLNSNVDIYGAVTANTVKLDSNAEVHYDESVVTDSDSPGYGVTFVTWQER